MDELDLFDMEMFGRKRRTCIKEKTCIRCGMKLDGFLDEQSLYDYGATGLCQMCQTLLFSIPAKGEG